jgi:hypothetical protein
MVTSLRAVARNPVTMAAWGLIVAVLLVAGSLPFFLGLTVVIPLLGHATWHLYRKVIEADLNPQPLPPRRQRERRSAGVRKMSLRAHKVARMRARTSWRLDGFVASAFAR